LLLILALAVIAVSANRRGTPVTAGPVRKASETTGRPVGGPNFVLLFPASAPEREATSEEWHWVTTKEPAVRLDGLCGLSRATSAPLTPVALAAADPVARTRAGSVEMDCRSYYDPTYDLIVYGPLGWNAAGPCAVSRGCRLSGDEVVAIFDELGVRNRARSAEKSSPTLPGSITLWRQARSASAAAGQWVLYQVRRWAGEWPLVGRLPQREVGAWDVSEYAESIEFSAEASE
jgi:hypothetical protein